MKMKGGEKKAGSVITEGRFILEKVPVVKSTSKIHLARDLTSTEIADAANRSKLVGSGGPFGELSITQEGGRDV